MQPQDPLTQVCRHLTVSATRASEPNMSTSSGNTLDYDTLYVLIARQGTLEQVSSFLRDRNLPHSAGSWQTMTDRLRRLREQDRLSDADLHEILRQTEEYGSQHVFLFEKVAGADITDLFGSALSGKLKSASLPSIGETLVLDMPETPTVTEVRWEGDAHDAIIFKIVERRHTYETDEQEYPDGRVVLTKNPLPYRSVSILRIRADGSADLRISSNSNVYTYEGFANTIWTGLAPIVDKLHWRAVSLDRLKSKLLDPAQRAVVKEVFGLRHSQHTNLEGMRLIAASPTPWSSIYDHSGTIGSLDHFNSVKDDAYCDRMVVMLRGNSEANLRDITLNFSGETNEVAINRKVTEAEYEWILSTVLEFNR